MGLKHYFNISWFSSKDKWYCTKLILECLKYAKIIGPNEISSKTSNVEDIYWFCVKKKKDIDTLIENINKKRKIKGKKKAKIKRVIPRFYIFPYRKFPKSLIL